MIRKEDMKDSIEWALKEKKPLPHNPVAGCEVILYGNDPVIEIAHEKSTMLMVKIEGYPHTREKAFKLAAYLKACLERGE